MTSAAADPPSSVPRIARPDIVVKTEVRVEALEDHFINDTLEGAHEKENAMHGICGTQGDQSGVKDLTTRRCHWPTIK